MTTFSQAIDEVKSYIVDFLREDIDIEAAANEYVRYGIEKGASKNGFMYAEIRGHDSRTGRPVPFDFSAVDED